ncbi:hypothetical protein [Colwellia ponticola]|uniref:Uncharacterized protein n=1 Tax=Colwellia ponticola TaxID=2304625 RepID=A0A8H2JKI9_9GAMM|nr:hypothetical protein [Colwellia ponticola]TMM43793.1 hypothetical protein FCS21_12620 [Colwellia ponticola]
MVLFSSRGVADGVVVDKVYHPYVLPNEREVEWRMLAQRENGVSNDLAHQIAYGQSITDNVMLEFYLIGQRDKNDNFSLSAYEVEARWMITEQGQYWADWGMLFEVEKQHQENNWELTSGMVMEKEFGRTSLTLNAFLIYEWGDTLPNEIETEFRLQYRFRHLEQFQPAIEVYSGENYLGLGPAFMGIQRFSGQKQIKWEAAFITGINNESQGHILRLAIEYEF